MEEEKTLNSSEMDDLVNRLSKKKEHGPKGATKKEEQKKIQLSKEDADKLFERLAALKRPPSQQPMPKIKHKNPEVTNEEIDQFYDRLATCKKHPSPPQVDRGEKGSSMDIDRMVERLSMPKITDSSGDGRISNGKDIKLSKQEIQELVSKLSNKEIALEKTPDRNRVQDKTFGIVASYAWSGVNHQAILCHEESP
eukprot:Seg2001.4 transcript_id=Seg2001.4/GoldUCD/mRNA.D3Y31 product="hypothetical protein" protein_id=Seg2001.4/GoldUCD/D3Y31